MNISDYFLPVGIKKPDELRLDYNELFSHNIIIHTPDNFKINLEEIDAVIFSLNYGTEYLAELRQSLYQLRGFKNIKIADLGTLKSGETLADSYSALRDVSIELIEKNVTSIILGGGHEFSYSVFQAYKFLNTKTKIVNVDYKIDVNRNLDGLNKDNFLRKIIEDDSKRRHISKIVSLAHQSYYTSFYASDFLDALGYKSFRMGEIRADLDYYEPEFRNSDLCLFDSGAIKNSDLPGTPSFSPNGLYGEEACRLARFAGLGDNLKIFGLFEADRLCTPDKVSFSMLAQIIWYFLDGLSSRTKENILESDNVRRYIVTVPDVPGEEIIFYESLFSSRWWFEIPVSDNDAKEIIPCSFKDYKLACNQELPERWLNEFNLLN